ncbi:MAG: hypothetical protein R3A78_04440 [Polyangiales bacterium]|nr:VOC family protein [Myxococcales bacterium]
MPNAFVHSELMTHNPVKAIAFYKKVFKWKLNPMPAFNYTSIDTGTMGRGGGIGKTHSPQQPTAWMPYVEVESVKKTIAAAKKAGAKIMVDHMLVGDMGALGIFVDPTGATLGVWETHMSAAKASPTKRAPAKKKATPAKKKAAPARKKTAKKQSR